MDFETYELSLLTFIVYLDYVHYGTNLDVYGLSSIYASIFHPLEINQMPVEDLSLPFGDAIRYDARRIISNGRLRLLSSLPWEPLPEVVSVLIDTTIQEGRLPLTFSTLPNPSEGVVPLEYIVNDVVDKVTARIDGNQGEIPADIIKIVQKLLGKTVNSFQKLKQDGYIENYEIFDRYFSPRTDLSLLLRPEKFIPGLYPDREGLLDFDVVKSDFPVVFDKTKPMRDNLGLYYYEAPVEVPVEVPVEAPVEDPVEDPVEPNSLYKIEGMFITNIRDTLDL